MLLEKLSKRGADFLNVKYPIIAGAMTWVSDSDLTAAVSNAGGFGVLAGGNLPPDILKKEIDLCFQKTNNSFAVNLITVSPVFQEQLDVLLETDVQYVIFAGGLPNSQAMEQVKNAGKKLIAFAPTLKMAKRLMSKVDAFIIEGHEAGGHVGPVSTLVLVQEILFHISDIPVFVAGGIGSGKMMAHLMLMGAAGVQIGTRFVLSHEANVHENMKKAFMKAQSRDASVSFGVSKELHVIPVRGIKNKGSEEFLSLQMDILQKVQKQEIEPMEGSMQVENFWLGALRKATQEGDIDKGSLMAGNSVGLFNDIKSVQEIIDELVSESEQALQDVKNIF